MGNLHTAVVGPSNWWFGGSAYAPHKVANANANSAAAS